MPMSGFTASFDRGTGDTMSGNPYITHRHHRRRHTAPTPPELGFFTQQGPLPINMGTPCCTLKPAIPTSPAPLKPQHGFLHPPSASTSSSTSQMPNHLTNRPPGADLPPLDPGLGTHRLLVGTWYSYADRCMMHGSSRMVHIDTCSYFKLSALPHLGPAGQPVP